MTGTYICSASNRHGRGSEGVTVTVQSVPAPPQGPLEARDVHRHGCRLAWTAPADCGGGQGQLEYVVEGRRWAKEGAGEEDWRRLGKTNQVQMIVDGLKGDAVGGEAAEVEFR